MKSLNLLKLLVVAVALQTSSNMMSYSLPEYQKELKQYSELLAKCEQDKKAVAGSDKGTKAVDVKDLNTTKASLLAQSSKVLGMNKEDTTESDLNINLTSALNAYSQNPGMTLQAMRDLNLQLNMEYRSFRYVQNAKKAGQAAQKFVKNHKKGTALAVAVVGAAVAYRNREALKNAAKTAGNFIANHGGSYVANSRVVTKPIGWASAVGSAISSRMPSREVVTSRIPKISMPSLPSWARRAVVTSAPVTTAATAVVAPISAAATASTVVPAVQEAANPFNIVGNSSANLDI